MAARLDIHGMRRNARAPGAASGVTLIEMAVAVFIIALLLGSILVPLTTQVNQRKISDTQKALEEIKESLIGFAIAKGYLPCPAVSAIDGQESARAAITGVCTQRQGYLPWAALGVSKVDAWGHIFWYSVSPAYTSSVTPISLSPPTATDITIKTRNAGGLPVNLSNDNSIPVVVLSYGKNGYGSVNDLGVPQANPPGWPAGVDEGTNAFGTVLFYSRVAQEAGSAGAGGEFDDIVAWVSPLVLFNRMVAAGKLP
jgi:type II secretory pathway pseudopilin PulG